MTSVQGKVVQFYPKSNGNTLKSVLDGVTDSDQCVRNMLAAV